MAHNPPQEWHRKYGGGAILQQWETWGDDESLLVEIKTRPGE